MLSRKKSSNVRFVFQLGSPGVPSAPEPLGLSRFGRSLEFQRIDFNGMK